MADPVTLPLAVETENDRLRMALADAQADLQRHAAALLKLQGELMASRLEVAGARGETVQFQGFLRRAEAQASADHAHIAELRAYAATREAEIVRLHTQMNTLQAELGELRAEIGALRASPFWHILKPAQGLVRLLRRR